MNVTNGPVKWLVNFFGRSTLSEAVPLVVEKEGRQVEYRIYDDTFGADNAWSELERLVDSSDEDAVVAAARFFTAMNKMKVDGRCYAKPLPLDLINCSSFRPEAILHARKTRGHHLYLTFIKRPMAQYGEVRILKALAEPRPTNESATDSKERHNKMTAALSAGAYHG
ncbi:hypothetical protein EMIT0P100_310006 [Pseudomonas sp. IT-P100]